MSTPEMPSVRVWCDLWIRPTCSPWSTPSTNHSSHSGRSRSSTCIVRRSASSQQLPPGSRRGQRGEAHVIGDVEALVVDPHRPALPERHRHDPLAESGDELQARSDEGRAPRRAGTDRARRRTARVRAPPPRRRASASRAAPGGGSSRRARRAGRTPRQVPSGRAYGSVGVSSGPRHDVIPRARTSTCAGRGGQRPSPPYAAASTARPAARASRMSCSSSVPWSSSAIHRSGSVPNPCGDRRPRRPLIDDRWISTTWTSARSAASALPQGWDRRRARPRGWRGRRCGWRAGRSPAPTVARRRHRSPRSPRSPARTRRCRSSPSSRTPPLRAGQGTATRSVRYAARMPRTATCVWRVDAALGARARRAPRAAGRQLPQRLADLDHRRRPGRDGPRVAPPSGRRVPVAA